MVHRRGQDHAAPVARERQALRAEPGRATSACSEHREPRVRPEVEQRAEADQAAEPKGRGELHELEVADALPRVREESVLGGRSIFGRASAREEPAEPESESNSGAAEYQVRRAAEQSAFRRKAGDAEAEWDEPPAAVLPLAWARDWVQLEPSVRASPQVAAEAARFRRRAPIPRAPESPSSEFRREAAAQACGWVHRPRQSSAALLVPRHPRQSNWSVSSFPARPTQAAGRGSR
jgi:hypothetical protein